LKASSSRIAPVLAVLVAISLNSAAYCLIAYLKYRSFNASVFDLGVSSELLYSVFHGGFSLSTIAMNKLIYLPLSIIYNIYPVPVFAQYIMIVFLSAGAFPVYLIARRLTDSERISVIFSILYLIYFPLGGVFWFDFHFMAFFPTFFLLGVYFYVAGRRKSSFAMMLLAAITDFLSPVIVAFFAIFAAYNDMKDHGTDPFRNRYVVMLLVATFIIFFGTLEYVGFGFLEQYTSHTIVTYVPEPLTAPLAYRLAYFVYLLMPLFFLSFLAPDFLIVIIPYFVLAVYNGYYPYVNTLLYQYPSLTVSAIFVSAVIGLARLMKGRRRIITKKGVMRLLYAITAFNVVLMLFLTPVGNLVTNGHGSVQVTTYLAGMNRNYDAPQQIQYSAIDSALWNCTALIPNGATVLIQNNMPQLTSGYSWILPDFFNYSSFPEYVVVDPYSPSFYTIYFTSNISRTMSSDVGMLLYRYDYGILASDDGVTVLERNYTGTPLVFQPINLTYVLSGTGSARVNEWLVPGHYAIMFYGNSSMSGNISIEYKTSIYASASIVTMEAIHTPNGMVAYLNITSSYDVLNVTLLGPWANSVREFTILQTDNYQ